jgi:group I intron endonuclease
MRTVYIYGLWDCRDNRLRYIGKTVNLKARLYRHCVDYDRGKITHCSTWVKGLLNEGLEPMMEILEECTEETWQEVERGWIAKGKELGLNLVNMVSGGKGGSIRGRKIPQVVRDKIRQKLLGRPGSMKGMKHTQEAKEKVRQAKLGKKNPKIQGRKLTQEHKDKIGAANAIALKGRKVSEVERERLRQIAINRWQNRDNE